ncbi:hypothetical protein F2P56_004043 [Juglans regia]|uniref:Renalase isoform X3 n=2 Tax=Juglans regia TaxID=51240 RepID=A0A2I4F6Q6_JUGRE|nr:renalase isoform X3 [Juglans regia]KAF5477402.1 hypothetical protein F2P56_004043 [Juglans regia]
MNSVANKVAVVGSGSEHFEPTLSFSGAVCASILARNGVSVTIFESARGPGGRMSQRREVTEEGRELVFDHGAPYFSVSNAEVWDLVREWESRGLVAEWDENFGAFDCISHKFLGIQQEGLTKKYVGVPGMNAICRALCQETGVESKFGVGVGRLEWLEDENLWSLMGLDGQNLGQFQGVVASDKNIVSPRFTNVTGRAPPLDMNLVPGMAVKLQDIPVIPCFALMIAFAEPLSAIPTKGFRVVNSEVLSWACCDSSKPGRSATRFVPVCCILNKFMERNTQFSRGSAFPGTSIAREEKCLWEKNKRLAICGDFCVSPNIEGAIVSGIAAASKLSSCW